MEKSTDKPRKKCGIPHFMWGEFCERDVWDTENQRCIFHSEEKPADEFKESFLRELETINKTDVVSFDARAFVFPGHIDLGNLLFKKHAIFDFADFGSCSN